MMKPIRARESILRKLIMFSRILAFLGLSSCALPPLPKDERERLHAIADRGEISVLFIGNSYSFGAPAKFRELAKSRGKKVKVASAAHGGWTLAEHSEHEPTLRKLRGGKWDVVVIQDHSLHPSLPDAQRATEMDPCVRFFVGEARAHGAVPMLYQTWGRRDGDHRIPGDDFYEMNERVRRGYREAAAKAGGVIIIPVGDAWEMEFRVGRGRELFQTDGSHPSDEGDEVTAEEFYRAIFRE